MSLHPHTGRAAPSVGVADQPLPIKIVLTKSMAAQASVKPAIGLVVGSRPNSLPALAYNPSVRPLRRQRAFRSVPMKLMRLPDMR